MKPFLRLYLLKNHLALMQSQHGVFSLSPSLKPRLQVDSLRLVTYGNLYNYLDVVHSPNLCYFLTISFLQDSKDPHSLLICIMFHDIYIFLHPRIQVNFKDLSIPKAIFCSCFRESLFYPLFFHLSTF